MVIIAHDEDISRLCGVNKKIAEIKYDDLPLMKRAIPLHFSNAEYHLLQDEDGKFTTLRELFELAGSKLISIDLKNTSPLMNEKVNELIKEFKRDHLTIWGSMFPTQHRQIG